MTPFRDPEPRRAVTLEYNKAEEKIIREGFDLTSTFELALVNGMLAKLRHHLLWREKVFRPMADRPPHQPKPAAEPVELNMDLLD
jgi:hypothetical protein